MRRSPTRPPLPTQDPRTLSTHRSQPERGAARGACALCPSHPGGPALIGRLFLRLSHRSSVSAADSGLRKGDVPVGGNLVHETVRGHHTYFQCAEQWTLLVKRSAIITVFWALSCVEISARREIKVKKKYLRHTLPPVFCSCGKIPHKLSKQLTGPKKTADNPNKTVFFKIVYSTNLHKLKCFFGKRSFELLGSPTCGLNHSGSALGGLLPALRWLTPLAILQILRFFSKKLLG